MADPDDLPTFDVLPVSGEPLAPLTAEGGAYAAALAAALADDVAAHPPRGPLRRIVLRWFWEGDPLYLTLHVLADGDDQPPSDDAWYPLEWANADREFDRTNRVLADPALVAAAEALAATFTHDEELDGPQDGMAHVPGVFSAAALMPAALRARDVPLSPRFAVSASHFEGWGMRGVLEELASPELLVLLAEHDELPPEE